MTGAIKIAASPRYNSGEGVALFASIEGITADGVVDGNFDGGEVTVSWPDVLKHAPPELIHDRHWGAIGVPDNGPVQEMLNKEAERYLAFHQMPKTAAILPASVSQIRVLVDGSAVFLSDVIIQTYTPEAVALMVSTFARVAGALNKAKVLTALEDAYNAAGERFSEELDRGDRMDTREAEQRAGISAGLKEAIKIVSEM